MKESPKKTKQKKDRIQTLQVGMSILDIIANEKSPLKFTEILELSGMTQSNLYKYLNTLKDMNFIFQNPHDNTFTIGSKLVEYGMGAVKNRDIAEQLTPYLAEIRKDLDETVHLNTFTHEGPQIIKLFTSSRPFNIVTEIGTVLPIHSAAGKLFALYQNDAFELWRQTHSKEKLEKIEGILSQEGEQIKRHRIAYAAKILVSSNASMAVPVLDHNENLLASIVVVGFDENIPENPNDEKSRYLIEKGKEISTIFGWKE